MSNKESQIKINVKLDNNNKQNATQNPSAAIAEAPPSPLSPIWGLCLLGRLNSYP